MLAVGKMAVYLCINTQGKLINTFGKSGAAPGFGFVGIAVKGELLVCDNSNNCVHVVIY